jgi:hypothetical protein
VGKGPGHLLPRHPPGFHNFSGHLSVTPVARASDERE